MTAPAPQSQPMTWEAAESAAIDDNSYYVVQHNGHEWRDFDLAVLRGYLVRRRLEPDYVRGRPEWIAKIIRPAERLHGDVAMNSQHQSTEEDSK